LGKSSTVKDAFKLAALLAARLFRHPPVIAGLGRYGRRLDITSAYFGQLVATSSHKADLNSSRGGVFAESPRSRGPVMAAFSNRRMILKSTFDSNTR
jgi:hypothetical protein